MYCTVPHIVLVRAGGLTILARPKSIRRTQSALLSRRMFSSFRSRKMTLRSWRCARP